MREFFTVVATLFLVYLARVLWLYVEERTKNIAREESETALSELRHAQNQILSAVNAEHQRRLHEFSLFTAKQHEVYAAFYRRVKDASVWYSSQVGLVFQPNFEKWGPANVADYFKDSNVKGPDADEIIRLYEQGEQQRAAKLLADLYGRVQSRNANNAFNRAKKFYALYELYLSDDVRAQFERIRHGMAEVSVLIDDRGEERNELKAFEKAKAVEAEVSKLRDVMRNELRRGESAPTETAVAKS